MSIYQIYGWGIECDMPDCYKGFEVLGFDADLRKMAEAIGWNFVDFPGENGNTWVSSCPKCSFNETKGITIVATDENHDCIYVRRTKAGKLSHYGKCLTCFICGKIKK